MTASPGSVKSAGIIIQLLLGPSLHCDSYMELSAWIWESRD